jgi:hypothetical protein
MKITFVKKICEDGSPCAKCGEVAERIERDGHGARIDRVVIADARDPDSEGMVLARRYAVERAPFFIVEDGATAPRVYTVYFKLAREILEATVSEQEEEKDILDKGTGVDFL